MPNHNNSVLPRGVEQSQFHTAVEKFKALLGAGNVLTEASQLRPI